MTNETKHEVNIELIRSEEALELVKQEIDRTLYKSPVIIRDYTRHLMSSKGKFIRATSVIICAEDEQGRVHKNAVMIAAAIEILHLATLVHDDIIDNAELRRGEVTLQKKYGKRTAVICGDYLLSAALRMAASIENKKDYLDLLLPDYVGKVCLGELNQHINNGNIDLSIYRYLKIISGKTAALFEASFFAGAIFSGVNEAEAKKYRRLGYYIGMIFQLTDDCIDFEETVEGANKPVQSDYEQGVITLPLIHALSNLSDFKSQAKAGTITRNDINAAVIKTGGIRFTRIMVDKFYNKSMKIIDELSLSSVKKDQLIDVLKKASRLV
ncbi:MAG: Polyprenyl synthetase [Firmicutes bacterium]|nr:Polyprenyl synthetase [Bacillota bacterium]